jgi:hypothetical protein
VDVWFDSGAGGEQGTDAGDALSERADLAGNAPGREHCASSAAAPPQRGFSSWLYYIIIMALLHFRLAVEIGK